MKLYIRLFCITLLLISAMTYNFLYAEGEGRLRFGYIYTDEEGNLGVNQQAYNLYEGASISLDDFHYTTPDGININADLRNITLNNRNLRTSIFKPGLFRLSVLNHQYRRIYDFNGSNFTRRRTTSGQVSFTPHKYIKIFGGYSRSDKRGENLSVVSPIQDSVLFVSNYTHSVLNVGAQAQYRQGNLRLEYRRFDFTDDEHVDGDRTADNVTISAFLPIPRYNWITLAGGYRYRNDVHETSSIELTTNQGWAAARAYLPHQIIADYRLTIARTDHSEEVVEIDNYVNTLSVGRNWRQGVGFKVGYENRINDDVLNRTVAHVFMASGWYRYQQTLTLRGHLAYRQKEVNEGATLLGEEEHTRFQLTARYHGYSWFDLTGKYLSRVRSNDDIDTRVDYDGFNLQLNLDDDRYGRMTITYAYYRGLFENRSADDLQEYEFSDHTITGMVYPIQYRGLQLSFGGTYYRSFRDQDTENFSIQIGGDYQLPYDLELEVRYQALNHDDFHVNDQYYTGNIVDFNLIKGFTL